MISIVKHFEFEAAHHLPLHQGACKHLHGHSYKLEVSITGALNTTTGMIIDFKDFKTLVNEKIINRLDHSYLNELEHLGFPSSTPTAENMVLWIAEELNRGLRKTHQWITRIRLWETSGSCVEWVP
jgi:6-pyruvoyltetrahydropterin/6-carboxytetrahydropterin synthase